MAWDEKTYDQTTCTFGWRPCIKSFINYSTAVEVVYTHCSTVVVLVLEHDRQEQVLGNEVVVWRSEC